MAKSYKDVVFEGAVFPDDPYRSVKVTLNTTIVNEYIPSLAKALPNSNKGLRCLLIAMTHQEGFTTKSRSYRTKNPGNVGNTDSGANNTFKTLEEGIKAQAAFITTIANGEKKNYPLGKEMLIKPFFSKEIHDNQKYGLGDGNVAGYKFTYTGTLEQFVKIYSTGARLVNSYVNIIVSYFANNGLTITPTNTLKEIINMA